MPKKYRGTYELNDEATGQVAACCDPIGRAMLDGLEIYDADGKLWQLRANRRIKPTRWALYDPSDQVLQFDQKVLGKIVNPLYRVALYLLDAEGGKRCRLVDPRTSIPEREINLRPAGKIYLCKRRAGSPYTA